MFEVRPGTSESATPARLAALFAANLAVPAAVVEEADIVAPDMAEIAELARAQGFAEGTRATQATLVPVIALLDAATAAMQRASDIDAGALRAPFVVLVTGICEAVVAAELKLSPSLLLALVDAALASISTGDRLVLRLHPDDAALLADTALPVPVAVDAEMDRGGVLVEAPHFVVADSFATRLAEILEQIG